MKLYKNTSKNIIQVLYFFIISIIAVFILSINVNAEESDITPPIIDNVVFEQNGKTLNNGDTFFIEIYAHDDESGIKSVDVFTSTKDQFLSGAMECPYNDEKGCYEFKHEIHDSYVNNIYIEKIEVTNNAGISTEYEVSDSLGNYKYYANIIPLPLPNLNIENLIFEKNQKTVSNINELGISIETKDIIPCYEYGDRIHLVFRNEKNEELCLHLFRNNPLSKIYDERIEVSYGNIETKENWTLKKIRMHVGYPNNELVFNFEGDYSFTLNKNYIEPIPAPSTIKAVHLDKNTENVEIGSKINITVDIDGDKSMSKNGQMIFCNDTKAKTIDLTYDEVEKKYYGIFDIDSEMCLGKWYIKKIDISDNDNNYLDGSLFIDNEDHPYYITVINQDNQEDVEKIYKVKLEFYEKDKHDSWKKVKNINKKVNNGNTLKEAGIVFPEMNTLDYKYNQIGWRDKEGNIITEDFKISSDVNLSIYAIYNEEYKISEIIDKINKWDSNSECHIKMDDITIISKKILEAVKNKNIKIVFEMNGYQWTLNGKDITSNNLQDINLEVILDTNNIRNDLIKRLAGNNPTKQLTLRHNGIFGFKATLTINIGKQYAKQFGNLFWYNNPDLVYMNSGKISENGEINLAFDHASDYVIVMSNKNISVNNNSVNSITNSNNTSEIININQTTSDAKNQNAQNSNLNNTKAPATGDNDSFIVLILFSVSAILSILFLKNKTINIV